MTIANLTFLPLVRLLVVCLFALPGAHLLQAAVPDSRYMPAGDLLDIVRDFQRLAKEDTYRFAIPKDVTGINIMKATLTRLQDYETKNRGQFTDIVQYNRALALERLREYEQAAALYPWAIGLRPPSRRVAICRREICSTSSETFSA